MKWCVNINVQTKHVCFTACYGDVSGFGYTVTTNDIAIGESANYTCWPGYIHVAGNLNRTCLDTLVLSGRRPTCNIKCTSIVLQQCLQCKGETSGSSSCPPSLATVDESCLGQLPYELNSSVALVGGNCYLYECKQRLDDDVVSGSIEDWTARYTCSRGNVNKKFLLKGMACHVMKMRLHSAK